MSGHQGIIVTCHEVPGHVGPPDGVEEEGEKEGRCGVSGHCHAARLSSAGTQ